MLPAAHRLRSAAAFRAVVRGAGGSRSGGPLLVVHARRAREPEAAPRVGFVVSKAVGGAVVRNRLKRRLRALVASRLTGIPGGTDVVVRANAAAAGASHAQIGIEIDRLLGRALAGARR